MIIDTDTIETKAGDYTITWVVDQNADQPYDEGFTLFMPQTRDRIEIECGELPANVRNAIASREVSGAAIVRYLTMLGHRGVTLVDHGYYATDASCDRNETVVGVAFAPDDATDPDQYTINSLSQWRAWADGDVFGWILTDSDGNEIESVWGYYGYDDERDYTLSEATYSANHDGARLLRWSRVGNGAAQCRVTDVCHCGARS